MASIIHASLVSASTDREFWKKFNEMTPKPSFQISKIVATLELYPTTILLALLFLGELIR